MAITISLFTFTSRAGTPGQNQVEDSELPTTLGIKNLVSNSAMGTLAVSGELLLPIKIVATTLVMSNKTTDGFRIFLNMFVEFILEVDQVLIFFVNRQQLI